MFKVKYLKGNHMMHYLTKPSDSVVWKCCAKQLRTEHDATRKDYTKLKGSLIEETVTINTHK